MWDISLMQVLSYVTILIFVIALVMKVARVLSMPIHLRWELYPIPHEKAFSYGGW